MARPKRDAEPWGEEDAERITELLVSGSGIDEVCAYTNQDEATVDARCRATFGEAFADYAARQGVIGNAMINKALFDAACAGNAKAMDIFARKNMGFNPLAPRDGPGEAGQRRKMVL